MGGGGGFGGVGLEFSVLGLGLVMLVGHLCDADSLFLFSVREVLGLEFGAGDGAGFGYE